MNPLLPAPEVLRWYPHEAFASPLPVMCLHWHPDCEERVWHLPEGTSIQGPPPQLFGFRLLRQQGHTYSLRVVWDRTVLAWESLSRSQLLGSCLQPLLAALGTDLWHLLDQPSHVSPFVPDRAA